MRHESDLLRATTKSPLRETLEQSIRTKYLSNEPDIANKHQVEESQ